MGSLTLPPFPALTGLSNTSSRTRGSTVGSRLEVSALRQSYQHSEASGSSSGFGSGSTDQGSLMHLPVPTSGYATTTQGNPIQLPPLSSIIQSVKTPDEAGSAGFGGSIHPSRHAVPTQGYSRPALSPQHSRYGSSPTNPAVYPYGRVYAAHDVVTEDFLSALEILRRARDMNDHYHKRHPRPNLRPDDFHSSAQLAQAIVEELQFLSRFDPVAADHMRAEHEAILGSPTSSSYPRQHSSPIRAGHKRPYHEPSTRPSPYDPRSHASTSSGPIDVEATSPQARRVPVTNPNPSSWAASTHPRYSHAPAYYSETGNSSSSSSSASMFDLRRSLSHGSRYQGTPSSATSHSTVGKYAHDTPYYPAGAGSAGSALAVGGVVGSRNAQWPPPAASGAAAAGSYLPSSSSFDARQDGQITFHPSLVSASGSSEMIAGGSGNENPGGSNTYSELLSRRRASGSRMKRKKGAKGKQAASQPSGSSPSSSSRAKNTAYADAPMALSASGPSDSSVASDDTTEGGADDMYIGADSMSEPTSSRHHHHPSERFSHSRGVTGSSAASRSTSPTQMRHPYRTTAAAAAAAAAAAGNPTAPDVNYP
ncbi:hypothetical protein OC845_006027 [Tilletia horrida]|nr:hypothetical protein OC845_006027 [Tilletia horrida]